MKRMTPKERLVAAIRREPHDRVPFASYDGFGSYMPYEEVCALVAPCGISLIRWCPCYRFEHPNCRFEEETVERDGSKFIRTTLHTPKGSLTREAQVEPVYGSHASRRHYIQDIADYDILDAYLQDRIVVFEPSDYERALAELGDRGVPMVSLLRSSWQQLWVQWVHIQDLSWHFAENEDRLMRTIGLLDTQQRAVFDCAVKLRPVYVDFPDNITAPMIGPRNFERFILPMYQEFSARMAELDVPVFSHMDGDLKPLWSLIGRSGLSGIDSFSPAPDNDTTVGQAVTMWPEMRVFMNFPSSVHLMDEESIRRHTREILEQGGDTGRIEIQLSENVPHGVWRKSLPIIAQELEAFGTPRCFR